MLNLQANLFFLRHERFIQVLESVRKMVYFPGRREEPPTVPPLLMVEQEATIDRH